MTATLHVRISPPGNSSSASLRAAGQFLPDYTQLKQLLVTLNTALYYNYGIQCKIRPAALPKKINRTKQLYDIDTWKMKNEENIKTKFALQPKALPAISRNKFLCFCKMRYENKFPAIPRDLIKILLLSFMAHFDFSGR